MNATVVVPINLVVMEEDLPENWHEMSIDEKREHLIDLAMSKLMDGEQESAIIQDCSEPELIS